MYRKILACILAILSMLLLLAGCNGNTSNESSSTDSANAEEKTLTLVSEEGLTDYKIIYAKNDGEKVANSADELKDKINIRFKSEMSMSSDEQQEASEREILIGKTNREESQSVVSELKSGKYLITVVNKKIVISGDSAELTVKAVEDFLEQMVLSEKAGQSLVVNADLKIEGSKSSGGRYSLNENAEMRIMTLNVALQKTEESKTYITNLVRDVGPDVLCLQECNSWQYNNVVSRFATKYKVAFKMHADGATVIYTPIIYNSAKLQLVDQGGGWLNDRYTGTNTKSYSWAVLKVKETGKLFAVQNLHGAVASNDYTGYENYSDTQLKQLQETWTKGNSEQMLALASTIKNKHGDIPVFFAGDFNADNTTPAYKLYTQEGYTEAEVGATVSKMPGYRTTHKIGTPALTNKPSIDHIFYDPGKVNCYVHYIGTKTKDELWASDHLMVYADFSLK